VIATVIDYSSVCLPVTNTIVPPKISAAPDRRNLVTACVLLRTGLTPLSDIIAARRTRISSIFGHIARFENDVPAHTALADTIYLYYSASN